MMERYVQGVPYLSLLERGKTSSATQRNVRSRRVNNENILVCGPPGSGKTVLLNGMADEYHKAGYTVVILGDKDRAPFDQAMCLFPVTDDEKNHIALAEEQQVSLMEKEACAVSALLYHPIPTMDVLQQRQPTHVKWFSFNIQHMEEIAFSSLFAADVDRLTVTLAMNIVRRLRQSEGHVHFLIRTLQELVQEKSVEKIDLSEGLPLNPPGDARVVSTINSFMKEFYDEFALHPADSPFNLHMVDVLNDQKHRHVFSFHWIKNKRRRYFYMIMLLVEMNAALASGKVKFPILLDLEELQALLPLNRTDRASYQDELLNMLKDWLGTGRQWGTVLATTQNYHLIPDEFRSNITCTFFFKPSMSDIKFLLNNGLITAYDKEELLSLTRGEFWWFEERNRVRFQSDDDFN